MPLYEPSGAAFSPSWASYVPAITGSVTDPVLNSGTAVGRYMQIGDLVIVHFEITFAADSTFGSGAYRVSLPVTALTENTRQPFGVATANDTGMASWGVVARWVSTTTVGFISGNSTTNWALLGAASPMTWANGDSLEAILVYEAA